MQTVTCHFCRDPLDPNGSHTYQAVRGWARNRTAGGTNAIALREPRPFYACQDCIETRSRGLVGQEQLAL